MENTQKEVIEAIAELLGLSPQDIDKHASFQDDLNLSPIELNDLISQLSQKFDVILDAEDLANVKTVDDLTVLIEDNLI